MRKQLLFLSLWLSLAGAVLGQTGTLVKDIYPLSESSISLNGNDVMIPFGKSVVFTANNSTNGYELWISDGTESGTKLVKDLYPGDRNKSSFPNYYKSHNGIVLFEATDNASSLVKLYRTDGTETGTFQIWDRGYYSSVPGLYAKTFAVDSLLYLITDYPRNNPALVIKDVNGPGVRTILDKTINADISYLPFTNLSGTIPITRLGNKWLFLGVNTKNKYALYTSDETKAGTNSIFTRNSVNNSSLVTASTPSGLLSFFVEDDGINGEELWKTDGTTQGTSMVKNIAPGGISGLNSAFFDYAAPAKNGIVFMANDGEKGNEVWSSDGTVNGTFLLKEFAPGSGSSFVSILNLTDSNQPYLYNASTSELWRTDGTIAGTRFITKLVASSSIDKSFFQKINDDLYCLSIVSKSTNSATTYDILKINTKSDVATVLGRFDRQERFINTDVAFTENNLFYVGYDDKTGYELWKFPLCAHSAKINTANGTSFCPGSSVTISAEGNGGSGGYTYKWKSGNSDVGTNATLSVTKAGIYTVEVMNQGCTVSSSVDIRETASLPVSITGISTICAGTASPLSASVSGGVAPYVYQWKQSGSTINGATTSALSVTNTGVYSVSVIDSKGCSGNSTGFSVTVKAVPTPTITTATTSLTSGASAVLATAAASGQTYQWYRDKQPIAGATNNTYSTTATGDYTVMVTRDGCSATSPPLTLQMVLANEPAPSLLGLEILPNPVQQNAEIRLSLYKAAPATFTLVDAGGKLVGEWQSPQAQTNHTLSVPMKAQQAGIYFLKVQADGLQTVRRVLKQ